MIRDTLIIAPAEQCKGLLEHFLSLGYYLIILRYYDDGFDIIDTLLFNMDNMDNGLLFGASFWRLNNI